MQITLESTIRRSPHFDEKAWGGVDTDKKASIEYELIYHLEATRTQYNEYLAKFSNMINEVYLFIFKLIVVDSTFSSWKRC